MREGIKISRWRKREEYKMEKCDMELRYMWTTTTKPKRAIFTVSLLVYGA